MGMLKKESPAAPVRCYVVVDELWPVIENAPLVIEELKILRYADVLPEILVSSHARS